MQNDDLIAALEWALDEAGHRADCSQFISEVKELDKHIRTIRALIDDLRAGNLVRRADVVAWLRLQSVKTDNASKMIILAAIADAIAAGAHEGGGDE